MNKYKPKSLKFAGEDSFIVPRPGTKKYLMAVATDVKALDTQNAINADTVALDVVSVTNPTESLADTQITTTPPVVITSPDWASLDCASIQKEIESIKNLLMVSKFSDPSVYDSYQKILGEGELVYRTKCLGGAVPVEEPTPLPPAPPVYQEPSWSSMTCEQIKLELKAISDSLANPDITKENYQILQTSLNNGTKAYERCNVSETPVPVDTTPTPLPPVPAPPVIGAPPITTITTTGTPIIATATAGGLTSSGMPKPLGGGGGGGGSSKEQPKEPYKETSKNLLWFVVAGAAVLYLLMSKKD